MANPASDDLQGAKRTVSEAPPAQYVVKIQSYSSLSMNSVDKYESGVFPAGGYKWKLVLYPNGNKSKNVKEHVSLYLSMAETSSLPSGWEVHALVKFFLLDQDKDSYLTIQDAVRKEWRFHGMKLECGFDQFIPLKMFNNAQNGYLMDDTCVFGAEVFVTREKSTGQGENLSMIKDAISQKHVWEVENFLQMDEKFYDSKVFIAGNQKWLNRTLQHLQPNNRGMFFLPETEETRSKTFATTQKKILTKFSAICPFRKEWDWAFKKIRLYPDGSGIGLGGFVSLFLISANEDTDPPGTKVFTGFSLRIMDQLQGNNYFRNANAWCSASINWGWDRFMSHANLRSPNRGYLVRDTCVVEAEVTVLGVVNAL